MIIATVFIDLKLGRSLKLNTYLMHTQPTSFMRNSQYALQGDDQIIGLILVAQKLVSIPYILFSGL
jgi:hypothetical protein